MPLISSPGLRDRVVDLARRLVQIPSPTEEEAPVAACIAETMRKAGLEVETQEAAPNRPNVVVRIRGATPGPTLLFQGHTDTIPPFGMPDPFGGRLEGNAIHGRGACDMKGPLAAALTALAAAWDEGLVRRGEAVVACTVGEEHEKQGIYTLVERGIRADYGVCCEPTGLRIALGQKGAVTIRVRTRGRATHGSTPERGVNAVVKMAEAIRAIQAIPLPSADVAGIGRIAGTLSIGIVQGGHSHMVVPDECSIWIDRRLAPGDPQEAAVEAVRAALEAVRGRDPEFQFEVDTDRPGFRWPPAVKRGLRGFLIEATSPAVRLAADAYQAVLGGDAALDFMTGWTEADLLVNDAGIPTVIFGPGRLEHAHSVTERIDVDELTVGAEIYRTMIAQALG